MSGRNVQRKLGTTRGLPRRSRTAKASRISRHAVKSRCAREWGGWGRLSDDGPGHYNPGPSEDPWGGRVMTSKAVHDRVCGPTPCGITVVATRCTKGGCKPDIGRRILGASLSRRSPGKAPLESQPSSRIGENPPYGMIGGIVKRRHHSTPCRRQGVAGANRSAKTPSAIITAVARMLYASIVITHQTKGISRQVDAEYSRYSGKVSRKSFSS